MEVSYPYKIKYSEVHPDLKLAWCDEGAGDTTFIFIHGLAGYIPLWKYQINELKKSSRCIAIDLPGNGLSSFSDEFPYTMYFYAEAVAKFIEKEKLNNVVLCGHSMGGQVAIILALRYPHLVKKLVLIAPSGLEEFAQHETMMMLHFMKLGEFFYTNDPHIESTIRQAFYKENSEAATIISDTKKLIKNHTVNKWNRMVSASIKSMLNEPVKQFLGTLNLEVLIIFGEKDESIPNKMLHPMETAKSIAESGAKLIKNSKYVLIPRAGHFVNIEKFDEVNSLLSEFAIERLR